MIITLESMMDHSACARGYNTFVKGNVPYNAFIHTMYYQVHQSDYVREFTIGDVFKTNGLIDAIWALRCVDSKYNIAIRRFAIDALITMKEKMTLETLAVAMELKEHIYTSTGDDVCFVDFKERVMAVNSIVMASKENRWMASYLCDVISPTAYEAAYFVCSDIKEFGTIEQVENIFAEMLKSVAQN
ncbi:MAG: hypothetical protein ACRC3J_05070 [Culicoidibacterales bacterium]